MPKRDLFVLARSLYFKLMSKIRTSDTSRVRFDRGSHSQKEPRLRSRYRRYDSEVGAGGVVLAEAEGELVPYGSNRFSYEREHPAHYAA